MAIDGGYFLLCRNRRLSYADADAGTSGLAHYQVSLGRGRSITCDKLAGHESGQEHLGISRRNGNAYSGYNKGFRKA